MLLTTKEFEEAKRYWLNKLSGELSEIRLLGDFPGTRQYKPAKLKIAFSSTLTEKIMHLTKNNDLSLVVMVLASFKILLYRYTGQRDIVVSTPIFNTLSQEYNKWILLRDIMDSQATFKDLLIEVKQTVSDAYKNQHYPFRRLIEHLNIGNAFSLFRMVLLLENIQEKAFISDIIDEFQNDIMVIFARNEGRSQLRGNIIYNSKLFKEETIQSLADHYVSILTQVLNHLDIKISDINCLLEDEKRRLLYEFNQTQRGYSCDITIHEGFEAQVEKTPTAPAVSSSMDFSDIYQGLTSGRTDAELYSKLDPCCFKKNVFMVEYELVLPGEERPFYILKTHRHNNVIVNRKLSRILALFNGERNIRSLYTALNKVNITFLFYSVGAGDVMEIASKFNKQETLHWQGRKEDMVHLVRALVENHLIEWVGIQPGHSDLGISVQDYFDIPSSGGEERIPFDILTRNKSLSKARVLLLGDTPGMATTGLLYMGAYLKRNGISAWCQFTDLHDNYNSLKNNILGLLEDIQPEVVAISLKWFLHIARVLEIAKIVKGYNANIKVVIGGNTASFYKEKIIQYEWVDYVVAGDGERPLLEICRGSDGVPNTLYKKGGKIIENPITYVQDRDSLKEIYLSHLDEILLSDYRSILGTFFINTQKGCGMNCFFCAGCNRVQRESFNRKNLLIREVEEVRKDIQEAMKYASNLKFDFDVGNKNLLDYCKQIWEGIDLSSHFCTFTNLQPPSPQLIEYVNRTFKYVYWNIDIASLSGRHRKQLVSLGLVKPQPTDEEIIAFIEECEKYDNTEFIINLIAGLPYFTEEDIALSEKMLSHIMDHYSCFSELFWARLHAQPGAPVVEDAEAYHMHSYARTFEDFLTYSQMNFDKNTPYPTVEYSHYPYIYFNDDAFNSKISKHYQETNIQVKKYQENKRETLSISETLTYGELNQKANQLAEVLREKGVQANGIVGLMMERSIDVIVGMLAILKAGGAYLPIDPTYPYDRIAFMLEDSGVNILLTQKNLIRGNDDFMHQVTFRDLLLLPIEDESNDTRQGENSEIINKPGDLFYVIYTSGSTGRPKGVLITHGSFVNLIRFHQELFGEGNGSRMSQAAALSFDAMAFEVWPCLLSGAALYIADNKTRIDPPAMKEWLIKNEITISFQPTMMVERLLKEEWPEKGVALKALRAAGDKLTSYPQRPYPFHLYNLYGPTEDTVWTTWAEVAVKQDNENGKEPVIGRPTANKRIYIIGADNRLQPIGAPGELCIAGHGLARGYLNRPELTADKFDQDIQDFQDEIEKAEGFHHSSFIEPTHHSALYRTGDLARWLPEGNLEFLGRVDHQVKIRGFRIELGEIENQLLKHEMIRESAVIIREDKSGDKYLCAYIAAEPPRRDFQKGVQAAGSEYDILLTSEGASVLKDYLSHRVPEYMIPSFFVFLEEIPLTPNGKVDRKALPEPGLVEPGKDYTPPRDELEERLLEIWAEVLGLEKDTIGIDSNFFESGGHSLKATILSSRIHKELHVKLPLEDIFKRPSIRGLAENVRGSAEAVFISIPPVEKKEYYKLSPAQQRLYFLHQLDPGNKGYNIPALLLLEGELDQEKLQQTLKKLIKRHESLRSSFQLIDDEPVQKIHGNVNFEIPCYDLTAKTREDQYSPSQLPTAYCRLPTDSGFSRPFDLSQAPLLRVELTKIEEKKHLLMVDMHHIITDGTSMGIFLKEFMQLYHGEELPPLARQYKDFSLWQHHIKEKEVMEAYWINRFQGEIPVLNLPLDYPRPRIQSFKGRQINFTLGEEETQAVKELAAQENVTLFMILLGVFNILLTKLSRQEDIVVGTPIEGRRHAELRDILGMFVNTLALRSFPIGEQPFLQFLREVGEMTLKAFENQEYPFEDLVEAIHVERVLNRNPLFDVMFALQNIDIPEIEIPGLKLTPLDDEEKSAKFDLSLTGVESNGTLAFTWLYCCELFSKETIERFTHYFKEIIASLLKNREQKISKIEFLSEQEKHQLMVEFNDTAAEYPEDKTIPRLFEEQAERRGDHIAVMAQSAEPRAPSIEAAPKERCAMTYKTLNEKSNELAFLLREKGAEPDTIIGILTPPSLEMIIGILGILKTGAAFLPIDPDSPEERIRYMLADSAANVLITMGPIPGSVSVGVHVDSCRDERPIYRVRETAQGLKHTSTHMKKSGRDKSRPYMIDAYSLAYLIYTSGTTGNPKGVIVKNENLVNYVTWFSKETALTHKDKSLLTSSFAFDLGYTSIFPSILTGGQLHVVSKDLYLSPDDLLLYIGNHGISYLKVTPSLFSTLVDSPLFSKKMVQDLRLIVLGGEPIRLEDVEKAHSLCSDTRIMNHYGPTEATIGSVARYIDFDRFDMYKTRPTIGRQIANTAVLILDRYFNVMPVGAAGELCIAGTGLAAGYLNRPELTSEMFDQDYQDDQDEKGLKKRTGKYSFTPLPLYPSTPLYRTGDLARWLPDGNIEFLGRVDHQVKIRGYRIELEEIENRLRRYEKIEDALVMTKADKNGFKYLCAYIVSATGITNEAVEYRKYLSQFLPEYMLPSYFVCLDAFPLTANNKIDRRALPEPGETGTSGGVEHTMPRNEVETKLVEIWQQVLGREHIGIDENFFMIGGDSIKTIQISSRMKRAGYKVEMRDIFSSPTIRELAPRLKKSTRIPDQSVVTGFIPLTPIQVEFFLRTPVDPHHYNQAVMLYSKEGFDENAVRAVFTKIQQHHDALRMCYSKENGNIRQINHDWEYPLALQVYDWKHVANTNAKEALEAEANQLQASINLEKGPLMKLGLFHLDDGDRLLMVLHHLVIDGISWRIILEDIETLFHQYQNGESLELPLKTDSFKVWSEKLTQYANGNSPLLLQEKTYWAGLETASVLPITKDFEQEDNISRDTHTLSFQLSEADTLRLLTRTNQAFGTEINDILLTAFGLAAREAYGLDQVLIALESHGRESIFNDAGIDIDIDISRTVGWFTSVYPVLLDLSGNETDLARQIKVVKEHLHRVPNNGLGYGILKYLTPGTKKQEERVEFHLEPQILFNYLGQFETGTELRSFSIANESTGMSRSPNFLRKYELEVSGMITGKQMVVTITYSKQQYKTDTIERLLGHYRTQLERMIAFCSIRETRELTPCDLTYRGSDISIEVLERLTQQYPVPVEDIYALSPLQEGMLFHALYEETSSAYFEQVSFRSHGHLEVSYVEKSLDQLFKRHAILRTIFLYKDFDHPLQMVFQEWQPDFYFEDIREKTGTDSHEKEGLLQEFKERDRQRSFDLGQDVLMRLAVLQLDNTEYEFVWSHHHILMDGWCSALLISEFFEIYNCFLEQKMIQWEEVKPYRNYIVWLEAQDPEIPKNYWINYLEGYEEIVGIPRLKTTAININKNEPAYKNERYLLPFEKEKTDHLHRLAGENRVTLNTLVQTVWAILLSKYNRTEDVVFGAVVSGRPSEIEGVESMIGLFINTIPVRIRCRANTPFKDLLKQVQQDAVYSEPYHYFPLAEIQANSSLKRQLLDHIVVFQNYPTAPWNQQGENEAVTWELSQVEAFEQTNYDFNLIILPQDQLSLRFDYNANIYDRELIHSIARHFDQVLLQVPTAVDKEWCIHSLTLLSEDERKKIVVNFNDSKAEFPREKTMHRWFEQQVEKTPEHIAVHMAHQTYMTYKELNQKSNQLARVLMEKGVGPNAIVGIMVKRSVEMVIAIMATLKAGGAYLPIDPDYPDERKQYMLKDSRARILVSNGRELACLFPELVDLNEISNENENLPTHPLPDSPTQLSSSNLAYVIYTSGTTGQPKGALIEHHSLVNRIHWMQKEFPVYETDALLLKALITFDVSVMELFMGLVQGARVCLLEPGEEKDIRSIVRAVQKHHVCYLHLIPSMLNLILDYLQEEGNVEMVRSLKRVSIGGEAATRSLVQKFKKVLAQPMGVTLHNLYGLTEATIDVTYYKCTFEEAEEAIPIGKPIDNIQIYILDKNMNLQPIGIPGELCISGEGLAREYLHNPQLTAEKFYQDSQDLQDDPDEKEKKRRTGKYPFTSTSLPLYPSTPLFRTGDLALWLPDGNIRFLGRIDQQVKIRGFRIEPGEIESHLKLHETIKDAVVVAKKDPEGEPFLCAYIVPVPGGGGGGVVDVNHPGTIGSGLRAYLSKTLPDYMIPLYFVPLEALPLTPSGKVNRKALPEPGVPIGDTYEAPRDDVERQLVEIWSDVLNINLDHAAVGINHNFFEWGGHSLRATRLVSRIHKAFNVDFPLKEVFERPFIKDFARFIKNARTSIYEEILPAPHREYYPQSSAQKRLFFLDRFASIGLSYHMFAVLKIEGGPEMEKYKTVFKALIQRHEILRTSFALVDNEPVQKIHDDVDFEIEYQKLSGAQVEGEVKVEGEAPHSPHYLIKRFVRPFDLAKAPLLRVGIAPVSEKEHFLLYDMHHIICDGSSLAILADDFIRLFNGETLLTLRVQYKDFSVWQHNMFETGARKKQEEYWLNLFSDEIPILDLPTDFPRPEIVSYEGDSYRFELNKEETRALKQLALEEEASLYMAIMAIYTILISKLSQQEDIIVGTVVSGRNHVDLERLIGVFVNLLPIRNYPHHDKPFKQFLREVKETTIEAFENQDYPFENLVEKVWKMERSRHPLTGIGFTLHNIELPSGPQEEAAKGNAEQSISFLRTERKMTKTDLNLAGHEAGDRLYLTLEYCTRLFKKETIVRFSEYFKNIISAVKNFPLMTLGEIEVVSDEEKSKIHLDIQKAQERIEAEFDI